MTSKLRPLRSTLVVVPSSGASNSTAVPSAARPSQVAELCVLSTIDELPVARNDVSVPSAVTPASSAASTMSLANPKNAVQP